uniref:Bromodomain containing 2 putative n=1 Tax=Albugo laibachii Nc14 TaxID=890382 RepID=F0WKC1_9STRA|nr:bromodomain containing 2 putative [Albugo laibachii Nc14]CCA21850.1 bromodomain containing 2 putative [Albugo laibachii Nc14]|eukprot:CCA21850.1 bromodomain containing 2 putative [Albugo laibachii Nc14]
MSTMISAATHAECIRLFELITNKRVQEMWSWMFMESTQPPSSKIKKPMDLNTVKKNLGSKPSRCRFKSHEKFAKDVRLVFRNAIVSSEPNRSVYNAAQHLLRVFETAYAKAKENGLSVSSSEAAITESVQSAPEVERSIPHNPKPDSAVKSLQTPIAESTSNLIVDTQDKSEDKAPLIAKESIKMTDVLQIACKNVLLKVMRFKEGNVVPAAPFLKPVDLTHFPDYRIKIPRRMHLFGVQKKLKSGSYATLEEFAADVRLVFSNCLVYNSDVVLSKMIRQHATVLMKLFEAQLEKQCGGSWPGIPERWHCHQILQEILAHRIQTAGKEKDEHIPLVKGGEETAQWFKYPIQTYYESIDQLPHEYFAIIKHPMDLGTVTSGLHEPRYQFVPEFAFDVKLIFDNCIQYWCSDPHGRAYCDSANALLSVLKNQLLKRFGASMWLEMLFGQERVTKNSLVAAFKSGSTSALASIPATKRSKTEAKQRSAKGKEKTRKKTALQELSNTLVSNSRSTFPEKAQCQFILNKVRAHKMKGYGGIEIVTSGPFLHAVDVSKYPDYPSIVREPMDFAKIERKIKNDRYRTVHEFAADVNLVFTNCMKYNNDPIEGADIRTMASTLQNYFVNLYEETFHASDNITRMAASCSSSTDSFVHGKTLKMATFAEKDLNTKILKHMIKPSEAGPRKSPAQATEPYPSPPAKLIVLENSDPPRSQQIEAAVPIKNDTKSEDVEVKVEDSMKRSSIPLDVELEVQRNKLKKEKKERKKEKKKKKEKRGKKRKENNDNDKPQASSVNESVRTLSVSRTLKDAFNLASEQPGESESKFSNVTAPVANTTSKAKLKISSIPATASSVEEPSKKSGSSKSKKKFANDLSAWEYVCDNIISKVSKIEHISKLHFDQPLLKIFPQLTTEYLKMIAEPMDMGTLRSQMLSHAISTPTEFVRKGSLIFQNAIDFNSAEDDASLHVREMSQHLLWYFKSLCSEQTLISGEEARVQFRNERATVIQNITLEIKARECQKLLRGLQSQKYQKNSWPFQKPVKALFPLLEADYFELIKTPMDLATIQDKLNSFEYSTYGDFIRDVRLTFENAILYNHADKERDGWSVYGAAVSMLKVIDDLWGTVTLEVVEKLRRREVLRKERERIMEAKRREEQRLKELQDEADAKKQSLQQEVEPVVGEVPQASKALDNALSTARRSVDIESLTSRTKSSDITLKSSSSDIVNKSNAGPFAGATVTVASSSSSSDTRLKLQVVSRSISAISTPDRNTNKLERKAEERRRKRARKEEDLARKVKRQRIAIAATDDALREAESRSRRRLQRLEVAKAIVQREERERKIKEQEQNRLLMEKQRFHANAWTGKLLPLSKSKSTGAGNPFWLIKWSKLHVPVAFEAGIDAC